MSGCPSLCAPAGNFSRNLTDILNHYIGFYGTERTERSLIDYPVKDEDADDDAKFKEELSRWKRTDTGEGWKLTKWQPCSDQEMTRSELGLLVMAMHLSE